MLVRDLLLSLATAGLYHARWTAGIHAEWTRNLAQDRPDLAPRLPEIVAAMDDAVPDCLVENYEPLIGSITLPDAGDRHVVAAAIAGHADAIVTFNVKHFPADVLLSHGIAGVGGNPCDQEDAGALEKAGTLRCRSDCRAGNAGDAIDRGAPPAS